MLVTVIATSLLLPIHYYLSSVGATMAQTGSDDLINARCQSKCLLELEKRHKNKNNTELRRQLRHQLTSFCEEDPQCFSCIAPCRESIYNRNLCVQSLCQKARDIANCKESCAFLEQIARRKPGICPKQRIPPSKLTECTVSCDIDADCFEIEKCCSVGCSRSCVRAQHFNDPRLLPLPDGITVQEKKRKRSAILRWIMKRMSPQHMATNSNLFIIQWRWSVNKQSETMGPWQTVLVRNKMYAILKHLLVPGRYYTFRIAAVNVHGTYGFSASSFPAFKLTKEVKTPMAPANLTMLEDGQNNDGEDSRLRPKISWVAPPSSDLPLKDYQLSWWKTTQKFADAYELDQKTLKHDLIQQQNKRHAFASALRSSNPSVADGAELEEDGTTFIGNVGQRNVVIPSYKTQAQLDYLEPDEVYLVELFATVDSSDGELNGEPAFLVIRTNRTKTRPEINSHVYSRPVVEYNSEQHYLVEESNEPNSLLISTNDDASGKTMEHANFTKFRAEVKTPYYENGHLKTSISWFNHKHCDSSAIIRRQSSSIPQIKAQFQVYIRSIRCLNELPPQKFVVRNCVATLENLQFDCDYFVRIEKTEAQMIATPDIISQIIFSTLPCDQTPSEVPLQCKELSKTDVNLNKNETFVEATTTDNNHSNALANTIRQPLQSHKNLSELHSLSAKLENDRLEQNLENKKMNENGSLILNNNKLKLINNSTDSKLNCHKKGRNDVECSWHFPASDSQRKQDKIVGFRIHLTLMSGPSNVSIVGPSTRQMDLVLRHEGVYRFRVQAITMHGLGKEIETQFKIENDSKDSSGTLERYSSPHNLIQSGSNMSSGVCRINSKSIHAFLFTLGSVILCFLTL